MDAKKIKRALTGLVVAGSGAGVCHAQASMDAQQLAAAVQREADMRVIAARCGTPAFEKSFYLQSRNFVTAGKLVEGADPIKLEKQISSARRSPFVLVASSADCASQLDALKAEQRARGASRSKPTVAGR